MSRNLIIILTASLCTSIAAQDYKPCLKVDENVNIQEDAKKICDEIHDGWIVEVGEISTILCHRTFAQRKLIHDAYPAECENRSLLKDLKGLKKATDKFESLMEFLLSYPSKIYATIIDNIAKDIYDDNELITYLVCSFNNKEKADLLVEFPTVLKVLTDYGSKFGKEYQSALVDVCWVQRWDVANPAVTVQIVDNEVKQLQEKHGDDFIKAVREFFRKYTDPDLQKILKKYSSKNDHDLGQKILDIFPDREKEAYATLARSIENIHVFIARLLHHFVKEEDLGGDFHGINCIVAIRTETDMHNINEEYHKLYDDRFVDDLQEHFFNDMVYYNTIKKLFGDCPTD